MIDGIKQLCYDALNSGDNEKCKKALKNILGWIEVNEKGESKQFEYFMELQR